MRFRTQALILGGFVAAFALAGGASSAVPKVALTVVVHGDGTVVSHPAGITCPAKCKIRVRAGAHVTLTAEPDSGSNVAGWKNGCSGASTQCTLTVKRARVVTVTFNTPPPPPPPPPPAEGGNYKGTYTDGTFITFMVVPAGLSVGNISYDLNGHCSDGGTSFGQGAAPGPYAIQPDGSFQGTYPYTGNGYSGTVTINGKFTPTGSASGTLNDTFTFTNGDTCTSSGTWTAQLQP